MTPSSELVFVLAIGLALAIVVVVSAWLSRGSGITGKDPLPDASFDFQESWLSTFTGLIAILGTISISSFVFISSGTGTGASFPVLSLFFAVLVAGGPLAFKALATANGTGNRGRVPAGGRVHAVGGLRRDLFPGYVLRSTEFADRGWRFRDRQLPDGRRDCFADPYDRQLRLQ